jgi:hydroxyacylglutathione hydrolase
MIKKISDSVWKVDVDSNVYFLDLEEKIIIDTGPRMYRSQLELFLSKAIDFKKVSKVIFTHLHADHIGNFDLFPNAEFFASEEEIKDFQKDKVGTVLDSSLAEKFTVELKPVKDFLGLKIIKVPGHTRGSICILFEKEKVLFTGDTLFKNGVGRTDLPTSVADKLIPSLDLIEKIPFRILAPGHDY